MDAIEKAAQLKASAERLAEEIAGTATRHDRLMRARLFQLSFETLGAIDMLALRAAFPPDELARAIDHLEIRLGLIFNDLAAAQEKIAN